MLEKIRANQKHRESLRLFKTREEEESVWRKKVNSKLSTSRAWCFKTFIKKCLSYDYIVDKLKTKGTYRFCEEASPKCTGVWMKEFKICEKINQKLDENIDANNLREESSRL